MRTEFLCISVLRVAPGSRVKLAICKTGYGFTDTSENARDIILSRA